jgi:DNA-directed RNA polymerase subunit K/omega
MSDIEEIDDISQNGDEEVDSVVASDVESDIEGSDVEGSEVGSDDDGSDIDGELSEEDPVNEDPQDQSQSQGGSFLDMLGGAPPDDQDELDEDILGENNKKIVHHDEILMLHPESKYHNYDEISAAALVTRNENNIIVDKLHRSLPILTKYEKAKVLGQRTKQLNMGSTPFVAVDRMTMDNSIIAEEELKAKKLPFIIQRPMPGGGVEYWHVKDLEVV